MVLGVGAVVGAGIGAIANYYGQRSADRRNAKIRRQLETERARLGDQQRFSALEAKSRYLGALSDVRKGYQEGIAGVESQRRAARVAVAGQGSVQRAATAQSMISRHLYNTTAYDARASADMIGLSGALDQIDANAEALRAQMSVSQGAATAELQTAIGQLELQDFGMMAELQSRKLEYLQSFEYTASTDWARYLGLIGGLVDSGLQGDSGDAGAATGIDTGAFSGSGQRFDDLYSSTFGE